VLLVLVFVLSSFLANIAAALIGGTVASAVFRKKVHVGYLAGIVAASNAAGSGSAVGDTTATMQWIAGASSLEVLHAYVAGIVALLIVAVVAAKQQHVYSPIVKDARVDQAVDWMRVAIAFRILVVAIMANVLLNLRFAALCELFPVLGVAVWTAMLLALPIRKPDWSVVPLATRRCFSAVVGGLWIDAAG